MLVLSAGRLCAASGGDEVAEPDISEILFQHIQNSSELELIPGGAPIMLPFGITVHLLMIWLAVVLVAGLFYLNFRKRNLKVRGFAVVLEALVLFVRDDIVYPVMGEKRGRFWLPFFVTLFMFILVVNLLGLIPAFKSATGNINVTSALALMILALIIIIGIKNLGIKLFFKNMYPEGTPKAIGLFVTALEILGTFIKSMVLSLRLFANMFAGHLAILSFLVLIFILGPASAFIAVPFTVFTYSLEVLVALIQALVFTLLSCIFIVLASSSHAE
jgi:F-type H+-transporting ATPase subunit a